MILLIKEKVLKLNGLLLIVAFVPCPFGPFQHQTALHNHTKLLV